MTFRHALIVFVSLITLSSGCGKRTSQTVPTSPRYLSLGAANTEVLFALGLGERVVGIDATSRYPADATSLPSVGFYARISAEGALGLSPTHVFASAGSGPKNALKQLEQAGVVVHVLDQPDTPDGARARITAIGNLTGTTEKAADLVATLDADLRKIDPTVVSEDPKRASVRVLFLYVRGKRTLLVGGRNTGAHEMIGLTGFINSAESLDGFVPLTAEAMVAARPDVIIVPSKGLASVDGIDGLLTLPGVAQTPAAKRRAVVAMDDLALLGFGPRMGQSARELQRLILKKAN